MRFADEDNALVPLEARQAGRHDRVLPFVLGKGHQGDLVGRGERLDGGDEGLADRLHEHRRHYRVAAMRSKEPRHAALVL